MNAVDADAQRFDRIYTELLGTPDGVFHVPVDQVKPDRPHIDVYVYRAPTSRVLLTAGMSTRPQFEGWRTELYMRVPRDLHEPEVTATCRALWRAAHWPFGFESPMPLASWEMLHGLPPLIGGSRLDAFVFTPPPPRDEEVSRLLRERLSSEVLYAFGITDEQRRRGEEAGQAALPDLLAPLLEAAGYITDPRL